MKNDSESQNLMHLPYKFVKQKGLYRSRDFFISQINEKNIVLINAETFEIKFLIEFGDKDNIKILKSPNYIEEVFLLMTNEGKNE